MATVIALLALVGLYAGFGLYVRKARQYHDESVAVWDDLYDAAKAVISDPTMPGGMAAFAAAAVMCAGCGCLTRQILQDALTGRLKRAPKTAQHDPKLTHQQRQSFARVVALAVYFDALQAPIMGFVLRRLVMPWLADAAHGEPAPKRKLAMAAAASREAINGKPEGRKVLALA